MYFKDLLAYPVLLVDDKASAMWSDEISTAQLLPRDLTLAIFVYGIVMLEPATMTHLDYRSSMKVGLGSDHQSLSALLQRPSSELLYLGTGGVGVGVALPLVCL